MIVQGRFWAEDSMFFGYATHTASFLEKVFYVYNGHLELISSLSHAIASYLNPKMAPLFTGSVDLLIECVLGYMIVVFRKDLSIDFFPALAICALLVVSPVASEHYLNILNSQWLDAAIVFLLINLPERRLQGRTIAIVVASLLLGLSAIPASALFPIALLYAIRWRSRPHALIAATLLICCLIQGSLLATHTMHSRFLTTNPSVYIIAPFFQIVIKHLLGVGAESYLAEWYRNGPMTSYVPSSFIILPIAILIYMGIRIYRDRLSDKALLLIAFLFVTTFNEIGALGDRNNMVGVFMMRYFFLPSLIVALIIARSTDTGRLGSLRLGQCVLYVALVVSTMDFFQSGYNDMLVTSSHSWRRDVDACRTHSGPCRIAISPNGFVVEFPMNRP